MLSRGMRTRRERPDIRVPEENPNGALLCRMDSKLSERFAFT